MMITIPFVPEVKGDGAWIRPFTPIYYIVENVWS
jgi:hypothetical protein